MGQTLTYGVYLPDEGERNCYSGLAQNWQILDNAVGAIAGKANASHTHGNITNDGAIGSTSGLPVITGTDGVLTTGAFGNTAGTFCEGNDSRLSDARTPVAHTHGKADITDLLNSNFIPSANNSYDLGSSSYQWNNLYAKNYYYNGTAWGLDKNNTWSANNIFSGTTKLLNDAPRLHFTNTSQTGNTAPSSNTLVRIQFNGSTVDNFGNLSCEFLTTGENRLGYQLFDISKTKSNVIQQRANSTATTTIFTCDNIIPATTDETELGTSSKKWKTLNGVNPGALSLPSPSGIVTVDTSSFVWDGTTENSYTAPFTGWIGIGSSVATYVRLFNNNTKIGMSQSHTSGTDMRAYIPMTAGDDIKISGITSSAFILRAYSCQGNV